MRIAIFDPYMPKFSDDFMDYWLTKHEVKRARYYDPRLVEWADLIWFETCDNNLGTASSGMTGPDRQENWAFSDLDMTGKRVVVRVIDIEAWYGHHNGGDWNYVDDVIFIAPHIKTLVERDIDFAATHTRVHVIPCGVNMDRFDFVEKPLGKKIAWICEKWPTKGIDYALQIMALLPKDYELHTIGGWNDRYAWEKAYQEDFIERNKIKFFDYEWVEDQNEWLADKDFILSCSKKEAFGYSIAEGMSKGLFPLIHHFYGAEHLWAGITWDTVNEPVAVIRHLEDLAKKDPKRVLRVRRDVRAELPKLGYDLPTMLRKFDEVIGA